MSETARTPGRERLPQPKQARSHRSLDKIIGATKALIAEKGHASVTVPEVVARAGCSVGCFYGHFDSKETVLCYVDQQLFREASANWRSVVDETEVEDAPALEVIRELIRSTVVCNRADQAFLRALTVYWHAREPDPATREAAAEHYQLVFETFFRRLMQRGQSAITHPDPKRAVKFVIEVMDHTITERILFDKMQRSPFTLSDEELVTELTCMFACYLGIRADDRPSAAAARP